MKFLFKLIFIPLLIAILPPVIFLAVTYKDVAIPVEDFSAVDAVTLEGMVTEEMDAFLANHDADSVLNFGFSQKRANGLLKEIFLEINPKFLDDTATDVEKNYVIDEAMFRYQGSWIRFKDDIVEIESGIHVEQFGFTYKTALLISFRVTADTEEVILTLEEVKLGNLPLAWMFGVVNWGAQQIAGADIETLINEKLGGLATYDPDKREIRLDLETVIKDNFSNDPQGEALILSMLEFIKENELLDIGFVDEEFKAELALGKLLDETTPFMLLEADKIVTAADLEAILSAQATSLIFSALTTEADPFIDLNEFTLNRMFEYFLRDQLSAGGIVHQTILMERYQITAYVPYIEMDNNFVVNIPVIIEDINNVGNTFSTIIKMDATPEIDGSDLRIVLNDLNAGSVTLGQEHVANVLTLLGDTGFIKDGAFVIENFDSQMANTGLTISGVEIVGDSLRLMISLNDAHALSAIQDAINNALTAVAGGANLPLELNDSLNTVLDSLNDPNIDSQAAVEDLISVFDTLTDEEQQAVYEEILTAVDNTEIPFDDILNLLP